MPSSRSQRTSKIGDEFFLNILRKISANRPTYGYRRLKELLNIELATIHRDPVNHKRIYRIMKENSLLLQRYSPRPRRTHDGKIITLRRNTRWCSDAFVIQCFNGDRVHVAFSLDTCDREIIRYAASTIGIDGALIRDLMVESVEQRFGTPSLPSPIQWLSDNGPAYIARETVALGRSLGFEICTTPSYSPESNGMAEAFVKTFKRDYVWPSHLPNAEVVMAQLSGWFEDYNENAPHKGLGMKSPRQFIRLEANLN